MTGDVEEECALLRISHQLGEPVSSNTCIATQADSAAYINSNMTIEDTCMYTTANSAEMSGHFPEGTVLQVLPDASVVALTIKDLPTSSANAIIFKDPSHFISDNTTFQNAMNNILTSSSVNGESQPIDVPVCAEENISDIDLSFLNEAEVTGSISDPKCLNETAVKELQGIITNTSIQPSSLLQSSHISDDTQKSNQEIEEANSEIPKDLEGQSGDVVMIDVSKPIQLSQNSLIMVNGQKCILQHDTSNGRVIAYPVKEQDKPRRRRGRPRKSSVEQQVPLENEPIENPSIQEAESPSEEEREQGLLEIVNDDGSLVRRSSRKRKRNKVLRDYETGNLQQELGSDVDDGEIVDIEAEQYTRKKKTKGPGRPRKYPKSLEVPPENISNNDIKRPRGRPRKHVSQNENEPTQAFLIQTADGQTLMMQVPMSSIPAGCTLQEVAEQIAKKLNEGLNQGTSDLTSNEIKDATAKQPDSVTIEETIENITFQESVVQDHSVGSTTNFSGVQQQLDGMDENSESVVDSSCRDIINSIDNIIIDNVDEVGDVTLENANCTKDVTSNFPDSISGNILGNQNNLNSLNVPQCSEDSFCINIPSTSTSSLEQSSILCNLAENLNDQFCVTKQNVEETLKENFEQVQITESIKVPKDLEKYSVLKDKINFNLLSQNSGDGTSEVQNLTIQQVMKNVNPSNIPGPILKVNEFKLGIPSKLIENLSNDTSVVDQIFNIDCSEQSKNVIVYESTNLNNNDSNFLQGSTAVKSSSGIEGVFLDTTVVHSAGDKSSLLPKTDLSTDNQTLDTVLPLQEIPTSENSKIISTSTATVIPVAERVLPMILPAPPATGPKNCKICTTPYTTDEELIQHFRARHPKCICSECDYMAERSYMIKRHFYRHSNQPCVCKLCDKKYKDHYILKMHVKMVHLPTAVWYTCDICEKQFNRKAHLKRHLRIHAPVKQFQCPHCEYKGCEKSDITKHLLIHQEPKFTCSICGKAFRHIKNMDLHMKRHSGKKDYKCGICEFFGYTFTDIRKHIERRHSNAACPDCGGVFQGVGDLKEHKKSGECQSLTAEEIKVEVGCDIPEKSKVTVLDEMILPDLLESDQTHFATVGEFSEETLSALQNGHFIMTSVEGLLNNQNCQFIMEGLEESNIINPEGLSVISVDKDSNQVITLVTSDGRNISLPFKNCSLPSECDTSTDQNETISEKFVITSDAEVAS